ncbi:hypothetical protein MTR67_051838 [Solanum verrucosum]|uniref:Uncharacterized protein n=1 Tax=Solanum verrucosum TaxID=315347 RepID=A0AAF0V871_SOLVR|nr:hypothetical protein MTR67_051838 [Solanum verrucosum]
MFEVLRIVDIDHVELVALQLKGVARISYDQWKKSKVEEAPLVSWIVFESSFLGCFFPRELREAKMVADMRSRMSLSMSGLSRFSSKEGKSAMLIRDMHIAAILIHVPHDGDEFRKKRAKTTSH